MEQHSTDYFLLAITVSYHNAMPHSTLKTIKQTSCLNTHKCQHSAVINTCSIIIVVKAQLHMKAAKGQIYTVCIKTSEVTNDALYNIPKEMKEIFSCMLQNSSYQKSLLHLRTLLQGTTTELSALPKKK